MLFQFLIELCIFDSALSHKVGVLAYKIGLSLPSKCFISCDSVIIGTTLVYRDSWIKLPALDSSFSSA